MLIEGVSTEGFYRYERIAELAAEIVREDEWRGNVKLVHIGPEQFAELTQLLNRVGALGSKWVEEDD